MLQSMYAGVSGLVNHQRSMDIIGNNISNVNTFGYKKARAGFADVMSISIGGSGVNPMQVGIGTRVNSTNLIFSQGGIEASNKSTDMAIAGRGFFVVSNGAQNFFTRNGNFTFNKEGMMVTPDGLVMQGRMATQNQYGEFTINPTTVVGNIQIPVGIKSPASPTSNVELGGNLNAEASGTILSTPVLRTAADGNKDLSTLFNEQGNALSILDDQAVTFKSHATALTSMGQLYDSADTGLSIVDNETFKVTITKDGVQETVTFRYRPSASNEYSANGIPRDFDSNDNIFSTLGGLARKIEERFAGYVQSVDIVEGKLRVTARESMDLSMESSSVPANTKFNNVISSLNGQYNANGVKTSSEFFFQEQYNKGLDFNTLEELTARLQGSMQNVSSTSRAYIGDISVFNFQDGNDRIRISMEVKGNLVTQEYYYSTATNPVSLDTTAIGGVDNMAKPFSTLDELIMQINSDFAPGNHTTAFPAGYEVNVDAPYTGMQADGVRLSERLENGTVVTNTSGAPMTLYDGSKDPNGLYRSIELAAGDFVTIHATDPNLVQVNGAGDWIRFSFSSGVKIPAGTTVSTAFSAYTVGDSQDGSISTDAMNLIRAYNDGGRLAFANIAGFDLGNIQVSYSGTNVGNDKAVNEYLDNLTGDFIFGADPKTSDQLGGKITYDNNHDGGFTLQKMGFKDANDAISVVTGTVNVAGVDVPQIATFVYDPEGIRGNNSNAGAYYFSSLDELITIINTNPALADVNVTLEEDGRLNFDATATGAVNADFEATDYFGFNGTDFDGANFDITFRRPGQTVLTTINVDATAMTSMANIAAHIQDQLVAAGVTGFIVNWTGKDFEFKNPSSGGLAELNVSINAGVDAAYQDLLNPLFEPLSNVIFSAGVSARTMQIGMTGPINYVGRDINLRHQLNTTASGPFSNLNVSAAGTSGILRGPINHHITGAEIITSSARLNQALNLPATLLTGSMSTSERFLTSANEDTKLARLYNSNGTSLGLGTNDRISLSATLGMGQQFSSSMSVNNNLGQSDTTLGDLAYALEQSLNLKNNKGVYVNENGSIVINGDDGEHFSILDLKLSVPGNPIFNAITTSLSVEQLASGGYHATTVNIIDSESFVHSLDFEFYKDPDPRNVNQWTWKASVPKPAEITGGAGSLSLPEGSITFSPDGGLEMMIGGPLFIVPNNGANPMEVVIDMGTPGGGFDGFTQYASKSDTTKQRQNGYKEGTLEDYSIDENGIVYGLFSNDLSRPLAQLTLADFTNPQGLSKVGNSLFVSTNASGQPNYAAPGSAGFGTIISNSLEMSNVDLSMEFTQMIIVERGFQANSRIISTSDSMIQEVLNMKR
ncbi:flagellar hook-basal body complex protein [Desulfurispirillum indicum]|uniref:flagellar hook-basal body complex protein n=1 Tax=Desulfurispirillum indicum TaxID=936456 RepID=UPI001CFB3244|nr:flagellar hook-basal body complex protein [Desulfurispirillum indicum]UCZ55575.1 flagellar hook-basal body complex protein [Desulfurispirillum indicum]